MGGIGIGIRWWLAAAFAAIAIVTAASIAAVSSNEVRKATSSNARNIAIGKTVSAGFDVDRAIESHTLARQLGAIAAKERIALFVFARNGHLVASAPFRGATWAKVTDGSQALTQALAGERFAKSHDHGDVNVVALPIRNQPGAAALVAYAARPRGYTTLLSIFRSDVVRVSIWAALAAALVGLGAASLVARRLRRITDTAAAIERGGFDVELRSGFRDEIGSLAGTIDRMRNRLGEAFAEIRSDRDRLEVLLDRLQEGVIAVDESFVVQFVSVGTRAVLGDASPSVGQTLPDLAAGVPIRQFASGLFSAEASVSGAEYTTSAGTIVSLLGVPAGGSKLAVLVLTDITERELRRRAEREFIANASHELRTPVTAIANAVEALESGALQEPESRATFIELIGRQSDRMTRLTNSLLTLARAQTIEQGMKLTPVPLLALLTDVAEAAGPAGSQRVRVDCEPSLAALAEPAILEHIVSNLLENALRHGASGEITLSASAVASEAVIEVADHGPGIPAAHQPLVFDRFHKGGDEAGAGFGLGLAIVRDSARAIGGRVELDSEEGKGTVVRVILPALVLS